MGNTQVVSVLFVLLTLELVLSAGLPSIDENLLSVLKEAGKRVGPRPQPNHPGRAPVTVGENGLFQDGDAVIAPASGQKLYELDMVLTEDEVDTLIRRVPKRHKRAALRDEQKRWPDATIPFTIATSQFSESNLNLIQDSMDKWTDATCIQFRPKTTSDTKYLNILGNVDGCWSYVGYHANVQNLNLETPGCMHIKTIMHELGHAIGLHHEQSRPDRDSYVTVLWDNIISGYSNNFNKYDTTKIDSQNTQYDYRSLMHYSKNYFAKSGLNTLQTTDPSFQNIIGTAPDISFRDAAVVNKMYGCSDGCSNVNCPTSEHYIGKDCECYCPANGGVDIVRCTIVPAPPPPPPPACTDVWGSTFCSVFISSCGNSQVKQNCRKTCNVC